MSLVDEIQADLQRLAQLLTCSRYERERRGGERETAAGAAQGAPQQ